jgi:hypothetical protein
VFALIVLQADHVSESDSAAYQNNDRRNSGFGKWMMHDFKHRARANNLAQGYDNGQQQHRQPNGGGYYGDHRPTQYGNGPPRRHPNARMGSEPMMYSQRPYGQHSYQHSQDTMATGGSDSTGPWANSTDPSSENSSIDKAAAAAHPHSGYGQSNGYGQNNGHGQNGYGQNNGYGPNGYQGAIPENGAYPVNGGAAPPQRRPIALGNSGDAPPPSSLPSYKRPEPEKRKSWLSRRFSKKG